jgi:dolichol-phosphate mannosyltransferase
MNLQQSSASDSLDSTDATTDRGTELTVVVPTRNEVGNVGMLYDRLCVALRGVNWEVIFVDDDSTDGTSEAVRKLAQTDRRVRLVYRIGRRGLASACIEGILASTSPLVAVMDADLQHDESLLPLMLETLQTQPIDVVIGSRYVKGGTVGTWDGRRILFSKIATFLGRLVMRVTISDPMSGFFMMRRDAFRACMRRLSSLGFKILIDIIASSPQRPRVRELPFTFRPRHTGESKLDTFIAWEYLVLLLDKTIGRVFPVRFILFCLVGLTGVFSHLVALWFLLRVLEAPFPISQTIATGVAIVGNYTLNNFFTYADQRLYGWRFVGGLLSFLVICSFGAVANVGLASFLYSERQSQWWVAGMAGAIMSSVWNYSVSSVLTWRKS